MLDVGCGPGALTAIFVAQLGTDSVSAIDPSESFVTAARGRIPGVDVRCGVAEALPWPGEAVDCAVAQLVVHLMANPPAGVSEMARVTRPGGTVAATVWDFAGGAAPVSTFWRAAQEVVPTAPGEASLPGAHEGHLVSLLRQAGLGDIESTLLEVSLRFSSFEQWWKPFTLGVGPSGSFLAGLDADRRATAPRVWLSR